MTRSTSQRAEESDWLFNRIVSNLQSLFGHSSDAAVALAMDYYRLFQDQTFCESIGISAQDKDFFEHEAPMGMAVRIHYYLALKGDPDPQKFLFWRRDFQLRLREQK
ncbi:hypothetical protein KPL74_05670 [Bacillus sp. NP157]|nr:hypothetical protein KPL74_05670 [Bacillus sp. NP157]